MKGLIEMQKVSRRYGEKVSPLSIPFDQADKVRKFLDETQETRICARLVYAKVVGGRFPTKSESRKINDLIIEHTGWAFLGQLNVKGYGMQYAFERIPK